MPEALLSLAMTPPTTAAAPPERAARIRYLDGGKLLRARTDAGLSQAALAERTGHGVSQSLISRWERRLHSTRIEAVHWLATGLGISPDDLMTDELLTATGKKTEMT